MQDTMIFKATALYKEFRILDILGNDSSITQRKISDELNIAVSMVNTYLDEYVHAGYVRKHMENCKKVKYSVTEKGFERKKILNIDFLKDSYRVYMSAKKDVDLVLNRVIESDFQKLLLYGAGEVTNLIVNVINETNDNPIHVVGIIDDDKSKQGQFIGDNQILDISEIENIIHDGILVTSYKYADRMAEGLKNIGYDERKILRYFSE